MSATPFVDQPKGEVLLEPTTFEALVRLTEHGKGVAGEPGMTEQLELLRAGSVIDDRGRVHPALAGTLAAIRRPAICRMELTQRGRAAHVWVSWSEAALLLPFTDDGLLKLTHLPVSLLPEALARLVGLRPGSRSAPAVGHMTLQRLLAEPVQRHWRLSAVWTLADGRPYGQSLEVVVDADGGLWRLNPRDDSEPTAWPTTPTEVWQSIIRLVLARR